MKKVISSILLVCLSVTLLSCGNASTTATSSTGNDLSSMQSLTSSSGIDSLTEDLDLDTLTETYLQPIAISGIDSQNWTSADEIRPDSFNAFYVLVSGISSDSSQSPEVSGDVYETLIQKYFDVSVEHLREAETYDATNKTYALDGVGGAGGYQVTKAFQAGTILTMEYEYTDAANSSIVELQGTFTIEFDGNDNYKYTSCQNEYLENE